MILRSVIPLLLLTMLFGWGCSQRETDIGAGAITGQPQEQFGIDSAYASLGATFYPNYSLGYGNSLNLGETHGMTASFAIRFAPTVSFPDSFRADSMRIRLHLNRIWPSAGAIALEARVREIPVSWNENDLLRDSLPNRDTFPILDSILIPTQDSLYYIELPDELIARWAGADTTYGLLFEPRNTDVVVEFHSAEHSLSDHPTYPPQLMIRGQYRTETGAWRDTSFMTPAVDDAGLVENETALDPARLYVSQGLRTRAALYFPLDSLTKNFTRTVVWAELRLYADTTHPGVLRYPTQLILFNTGVLNDNDWLTTPDSLTNSILGREFAGAARWDATSSHVTMDVSRFLGSWIALPDTNNGIQILSSDESAMLSREVFHSPSTEDNTKRPKLYIWYTESSY